MRIAVDSSATKRTTVHCMKLKQKVCKVEDAQFQQFLYTSRISVQVVGGVLVNEKAEILACKRGANQVMGGHWEFPGGKIDSGETTTAALERELLEELGIEAQVGSFIDKVVHDYSSMIVNIEFYKCVSDAKVFSQVVHDDFQWVDEKSASSLNWLPADIDFVQQLIMRGFSSI